MSPTMWLEQNRGDEGQTIPTQILRLNVRLYTPLSYTSVSFFFFWLLTIRLVRKIDTCAACITYEFTRSQVHLIKTDCTQNRAQNCSMFNTVAKWETVRHPIIPFYSNLFMLIRYKQVSGYERASAHLEDHFKLNCFLFNCISHLRDVQILWNYTTAQRLMVLKSLYSEGVVCVRSPLVSVKSSCCTDMKMVRMVAQLLGWEQDRSWH